MSEQLNRLNKEEESFSNYVFIRKFICGDSAPFCFGRETKSLKRIFIVTFWKILDFIQF